MQIEECGKLWLTDVLVPDLFITDYLPRLSSNAVKVYLFSLHVARHHVRLSREELTAHIGLDEKALKDALLELAREQVIHILGKGDKYSLNDLKEIELTRLYRSREKELPGETLKRLQKDKEKMQTLRQISDTFFHGQIGMKWVHFIDECYHEYNFEPTVVYALFSEVSALNKLVGNSYIREVARAWKASGVRNYSDLIRYSEERERVKRIARQVGRKLRKNIGEPEEAMVRHWVEDYGYDFKMISRALDASVRISNPNLNYFDAILRRWYEAGLSKPEEIEAYEQKMRNIQQTNRAGARSARGKGEVPDTEHRANDKQAWANFEQRQYTDAFYESLYEDLSAQTGREQEMTQADDKKASGRGAKE